MANQLPAKHIEAFYSLFVVASLTCPCPLPLQAIQYVAEHGEVCPAGWKPGDRTMVADPEKSLEYFEAAAGGAAAVSNCVGQCGHMKRRL